MDDSYDIAIEHFTWARAQGLSNDEILATIATWAVLNPTDRLVIGRLTEVHRELQQRQAA